MNHINETTKIEEAIALNTLVGFSREDVANGDTITSEGMKERLHKRKEILKKEEQERYCQM